MDRVYRAPPRPSVVRGWDVGERGRRGARDHRRLSSRQEPSAALVPRELRGSECEGRGQWKPSAHLRAKQLLGARGDFFGSGQRPTVSTRVCLHTARKPHLPIRPQPRIQEGGQRGTRRRQPGHGPCGQGSGTVRVQAHLCPHLVEARLEKPSSKGFPLEGDSSGKVLPTPGMPGGGRI